METLKSIETVEKAIQWKDKKELSAPAKELMKQVKIFKKSINMDIIQILKLQTQTFKN